MTDKNAGSESRVAEHYDTTDLSERILAAFEATGKRREDLTFADLATVDEFHIGGREATEAIAAQMNLREGMQLLDIGSGIGGPARYFAATHKCKVTGIDLTEEYVRTAAQLSEQVGMGESVKFQQGSALQLPFAAESFDGAYMFHVGMNIREKGKLLGEVKRVLRQGGVFAIFDVMQLGAGELAFPVPWASGREESFVASPREYREALMAQGFSVVAERTRREFAEEFFERMQQRNQQPGVKPPGVHLIMGETAVAKVGNFVAALRGGVMAPVEMIARA